ncbi:MAG: hypothetical protein HY791_00050 [Deltaproteobacteria bacterium]|nr:hypothetical protein [Deltaproteobacteria bacterium]
MASRRLAALLFCSSIAACGGDTVSGGSCVTNRDCTGGKICVAGRCEEPATTGCTNDDGCGTNEYCDVATSTCKPSTAVTCGNDTECPADQRCNTLTGVCVSGARACTTEAQCVGIGKHCDLGVQQCRDCTGPSHCTGGMTCVAGACVTPQTGSCSTDTNCTPPLTVCESGMCTPGCGEAQSTVMCGSGTVCDTTRGRCGPAPTTCSTDSECRPNGVCEGGRCTPDCTEPGGLVCSGTVCDPTSGRCRPPTTCAQDFQCAPPATVCEQGSCTAGCGQAGGLACSAGSVCDTRTGRCTPVSGACSRDDQCQPPNTVCESGQCVNGCGRAGGIACTVGTTCDPLSGRCAPDGGVCFDDGDCGPPSQICDFGDCIPGCATTGCAVNEQCDTQTGHCAPVNPNPGSGQLGAPCLSNAECASTACFDFDGLLQPECVASCGRSADCPAGFTCYDFTGGRMCLSAALFGGASFAGAPASACTGGGECRSNYCPNNACAETCSVDRDCTGTQCGWRELPDGSAFVSSCEGHVGVGSVGDPCNVDGECKSGVCQNGSCASLCRNSGDCPTGRACFPATYSTSFDPFFVKACLEGPHGADAVGDPCTTFDTCRSGLCHTGIGQCVDVCSSDADCPASHRCKIEVFGSIGFTTAYFNVCEPAEL